MKNILSVFVAVMGSLALSAQTFVGGDISLLPSYEQANTPYYSSDSKKISDLVVYLHDVCKWNVCRVRLFVNPVIVNADGSKQGEVQDLEYAAALGKRIKDAGMALMLDFHYSDTWADPVKQTIPAGWKGLTEQQLTDTMYSYTKMCLMRMVEAGAQPDFVQLGNEISCGMLWRSNSDKFNSGQAYSVNPDAWQHLGRLLRQASKATREVCPEAQIVIHIERTQFPSACVNYYNCLEKEEVDFDIIGLSYYPFWHGWLNQEQSAADAANSNKGNLAATLKALANAFPERKVQIVETAYYNNYFPTNDSGTKFKTSTVWPGTESGQDAYLSDLIAELKKHANVNGLYYWFPEENGNGGASYNANNIVITSWLNRGLFHPSNHKALKGLYRLSEYADTQDAISEPTAHPAKDGIIYSLLGQPLGTDVSCLPQGVYIMDHKLLHISK